MNTEVFDTSAWLAHRPGEAKRYACEHHWTLVRRYGVTFDGSGVPSIRRPATIQTPASPADRFLPLIEQMYAREWLLERTLETYRGYVSILENEPTSDETLFEAQELVAEADRLLAMGAVPT